jgi:hypothetical protein
MVPRLFIVVMAGLVAAIREPRHGKSVDDQLKSGHDEEKN